jgi:hypothetical protein
MFVWRKTTLHFYWQNINISGDNNYANFVYVFGRGVDEINIYEFF